MKIRVLINGVIFFTIIFYMVDSYGHYKLVQRFVLKVFGHISPVL